MTSTFSSISLAAAASAAVLLLAACAANPGMGSRPGAGTQQSQVVACSGEPARGVPTWRWVLRRDGTCEAG